ncbi:haloacid dehalogenase-like hydrolase [Xylariales sp. PMI_506]|nr:haloacid dehalogenase-like hydrolase [Xylariales sp. PMI_506]
MARPNLLLCFDAFGTLFRPKRPVTVQYAEVARQCGITGFNDTEIQSSFRAAMKDEAKLNPNYGKATGLGATLWWTNVINKTFTPLIRKDQAIPKDLAPKLHQRFSSSEAYEVEPDFVSTFKALKQRDTRALFDRVTVGVITNSDDRIPGILSSFGLNVSPLRFGTEVSASTFSEEVYDVDFHCMSYDVGAEKPEKLIFDSAELMLAQILAAKDGKSPGEARADAKTWEKVYVGDEYAKDIIGARDAGWNPVLIDPREVSNEIPKLEEDKENLTLAEAFRKQPVVKVLSIKDLTTWLTGWK